MACMVPGNSGANPSGETPEGITAPRAAEAAVCGARGLRPLRFLPTRKKSRHTPGRNFECEDRGAEALGLTRHNPFERSEHEDTRKTERNVAPGSDPAGACGA